MKGKGQAENIEMMLGEGHERAFTNLYAQYFAKLLIQSNKYVKDEVIAEEIVQNVFMKIWERAVDFNEIDSIKSYLYRSVINQSINHVNRQRNIEVHHQKILNNFTEEQVTEIDEENELIVLLYEEIEKLPAKCREIFKLSRFERLKYKEIALKLNVAEKTVENHVANALKLLREAMVSKKDSISGLSNLKILRLLTFF